METLENKEWRKKERKIFVFCAKWYFGDFTKGIHVLKFSLNDGCKESLSRCIYKVLIFIIVAKMRPFVEP